jgi:hypothetical protein
MKSIAFVLPHQNICFAFIRVVMTMFKIMEDVDETIEVVCGLIVQRSLSGWHIDSFAESMFRSFVL